MKSTIFRFTGILVVGLAAAVWWYSSHRATPSREAAPRAQRQPLRPIAEVAASGEPTATPIAPPPTVDVAAQVRAQMVATDRMVLAHNPLRAPAVADPDSPENQQILQTVISKALSRPAMSPPVRSTSN